MNRCLGQPETHNGAYHSMIDSYSFGEIVINGKTYTHDIILCGDAVYPEWWRKSGHALSLDDLTTVLDFNPSLLIIGTGAMGVMNVPSFCQTALRERGIAITVEKTGRACTIYNRLLEEKREKRISAVLHLTC